MYIAADDGLCAPLCMWLAIVWSAAHDGQCCGSCRQLLDAVLNNTPAIEHVATESR